MKNQVVAGDYKNWDVIFNFGKMYFMHRLKKVKITKSMVSSWDVIDDIEKNYFNGTGIEIIPFSSVTKDTRDLLLSKIIDAIQ